MENLVTSVTGSTKWRSRGTVRYLLHLALHDGYIAAQELIVLLLLLLPRSLWFVLLQKLAIVHKLLLLLRNERKAAS